MGSLLATVASSYFDGDILEFTLHKYGDLSFTTDLCENVGPEFNPLEDPHNPTSSSAATVRGGIDNAVLALDTSGTEGDTASWTQTTFLQNLGGLNSIIGRSV